jgi:hypothetical protein
VEKRKGGLRRLAVLFAVASVGVLAVGAHAASAQVIEICKTSANGMSGRTFQYSITGGTQVSVNGGRCSGPITVAGATVTITEAQSSPATDVASTTVRPTSRKISEDLANRSVTVATGATTSSETLVYFTNQPAGGNLGTLKICKLTQTPAYLGRLFSFSVNGGPLVSTEANDAFDNPANWSCRILGNFQVGSNVTVHEAIPSGTEIQFIDSDPANALVDFNTATGDAVYNIQAGTTVALYDDEPLAPTGTGTLQICKQAAELTPGNFDPDVHGTFTFTAVDAAGASYGPLQVTVPANSGGTIYCTAPITVAAGITEVTEGPSPGFDLVDAYTFPADRFLTSNLINRTVDVEIPSSANPNDETEVVFVNQTQRAQLKICKALGPGSSDLVNQTFTFTAAGSNGVTLYPSITAQAATQCVIVGNFPIGSTVDVSENLNHGSGQPGEFIDTTGEGTVTMNPGINTITITNTARGLLEVCKAAVANINTPPTFTFRIDGAGMLSVRAGTCSLAQRVSVGTHTVTEVASDNYELDPYAKGNGITVSPSAAEVSRSLSTRTVTVNVPYGQDVAVRFFNRIRLGQVKVCKVIPVTSQDSLGTKPFDYTVYVQQPGMPGYYTYQTESILPGECTNFGPYIPVLNPDGTKRAIGVHENQVPSATFTVTAIGLVGTRGLCTTSNAPGNPVCPYATGQNLANGDVDFFLGPGNNIVTYTNRSNDP